VPAGLKSRVDSPYAWAIAFSALILTAAGSGALFLVGIAIVPRASEFGIDIASASLPYGLAMLGMGIGGIAMGWLADRVGPFWPAALGSLSIALGGYLVSRSEQFGSIALVYALLFGLLGNAGLVTPLFVTITRWFDERRGVAAAVVGSGQALGGALWPLVFHWSVEGFGWRATYGGYALFAAVLMLPLACVLRRPVPEEPAHQRAAGSVDPAPEPVLGLPPNLVVALLCLAIVGCCIPMSLPLVHLPKYVVERGFDLGQGARILSVAMVVSMGSRITWGFLCDRIGGLQALFIASALQATSLALMAMTSSQWGLYGVAVFFGLGFGGILPCYPVILRTHFPIEGLGWRIGVVLLFGSIGMAVGPELAGRLFAATGDYGFSFAAAVGINLVNLAIVGTLNLRHQRLLREIGRPALA